MKIQELKLSDEQQKFIDVALSGRNIIVDACIGSGKTTSIQRLCDCYPSTLKILYLTYNKLLKIDAKTKIRNKNVMVTNYHGFAYLNVKNVGINDLVQAFNKIKPRIEHYDVLIIDEYQDIEQELSDMLVYIKSTNPQMQIIAVGDMQQKIYDKTNLCVERFINDFLGEHKKLEFTKCFRLSKDLAAKLGRIWQKNIVGVNDECSVIEMPQNEVVSFLARCNPADILCLGARTGALAKTLNLLESKHPLKFNKNTVFASIVDDGMRATSPKPTSAIFTTFDSSKGLERKICVVFDFEEAYWFVRAEKPQQSYEILRNIFCVAASRGKDKIIFVKTDNAILSEKTLSTSTDYKNDFELFSISTMFDFKYREDIEKCYDLLEIKEITNQNDIGEITIRNYDGLIDLSPCIGIYQEAAFFEKYNINKAIQQKLEVEKDKKFLWTEQMRDLPIDDRILFLVSLETKQNRYREQVKMPFVNEIKKGQLKNRLSTLFLRTDETQVECKITFLNYKNNNKTFSAVGLTDIVKDNVVYELKFVEELSHEHFLQCACYTVALNLEKGILINTRSNKQFEITINNKQLFFDAVINAITKGYLSKYVAQEKIIEIKKRLKTSKPKQTHSKTKSIKSAVNNINDREDKKTIKYFFDKQKKFDKYYAVIRGEKSNCIFSNWSDCSKVTQNYSNSKYKSFKKLKDAEDYIVRGEEV